MSGRGPLFGSYDDWKLATPEEYEEDPDPGRTPSEPLSVFRTCPVHGRYLDTGWRCQQCHPVKPFREEDAF